MKRILCLLILALLTLLTLTAAVSGASQPNILWITAEDMSRELGCYGSAYADTPHLDRLAAGGVRFTRFFAESPMCAPSRASIITGMHNGPLGASQMRSLHRVPTFVRPFTGWLRDAGYYCVNNSKTDYNLARDASGDNAEFIREGWHESSPKAHWRNCPESAPFFCVLNYTDTHQSRLSRDDYSSFVEKVQSRLPKERIHDPAKAPLPPHYPDSQIARRTVARYHDCITTLDDFVGKTLADLKADGLDDDTIVFFYSDHGAGMPTGKACATDWGLRCPLIVHFPEKYHHLAPGAPGSVNDRLTCFVDLAPTVLHLAGVTPPAHFHGQPFVGAQAAPAPAYVFGSRDRMDETLETTRWITDGRYLLVRAYRRDIPADQQSLTSHYNGKGELCREIRALARAGKLTDVQRRFWSGNRPAISLFDSETDPWNLDDLATNPAHRERIDAMVDALEGHMLKERDLGFWPEPELADAEKDAAPYEVVRSDPARYPLERIMDTAKCTDAVTLVSRLVDADASVRYWALASLATLGEGNKPAIAGAIPLLKDPAAAVRIEAAYFVGRFASGPSADESLDVLVREMDSANEWAATRAARALELLGEKARPTLAAMRRVLADRSSGFEAPPKGPRAINAGLEFSLRTALDALGEQVQKP